MHQNAIGIRAVGPIETLFKLKLSFIKSVVISYEYGFSLFMLKLLKGNRMMK